MLEKDMRTTKLLVDNERALMIERRLLWLPQNFVISHWSLIICDL